MALADIITKIEDDAKARAEALLNAARAEAKTILTDAEKEVAAMNQIAEDDAARAASKAHGRVISVANHKAKFATQTFRVSLIDRTLKEVEHALATMPKEAYHAYVTKHAESLPEKTGTLTISSERKEETLAALKKAHVATDGAKEAPLLGGFILETKTAVYDHSVKTVAARTRESLSADIAQELFSSK